MSRVESGASDADNGPLFTIALVVSGFLLLVYLLMRQRSGRKSIPGPWIPPSNRNNLVDLKEMEDCVQKYGPMFGFRVPGMRMLFLCDVDSIKEALVGQADVFAGRMKFPLIMLTGKESGVIFIDGPKWQEHRRFILSVLRTFGFGKNITERIIQEELLIVGDEFAAHGDESFFPRMTLLRSAANVICLLVFGERCGDEPEFEMLVKTTSGVTGPDVPYPFLIGMFHKQILKLPGDFFGLKKYLEDNTTIENYLNKKIEQHLEKIDWNDEQDLIDAYLIEIRKRNAENPSQQSFTVFQTVRVLVELFIAGMETTSTTITWAIHLMARHPEIQSRVQEEIDNVIGEKVPQISDRSKLPYTTAVLHEVERFVTVSTFAVPHSTMQDTELRGYFVPKGTMVMPYLLGAHRDPALWKNPKKFDPSHFFDENTKSLINLQNLIPFSLGKRACLGESLAAQELFVMFAGLMQRFRFEMDPNKPLPQINEDKALIPFRTSMPYYVKCHERSSAETVKQ